MSDNDIPPPLVPDHPTPRNDELMIPFKMADAVRLQLEFLARSRALADTHRQSIRSWLDGYNRHMAGWLFRTYGEEGLAAADALSKESAQRMSANQTAAQQEAERKLFNELERDFKDGE